MFRFGWNAGLRTVAPVIFFGASSLFVSTANAQTLYDGSLGSTPAAQGWLSLGNLNASAPTVVATESYNSAGGFTTLDSSVSNSIYSGYSNYSLITQTQVNPNFPVLNATTGFTYNFTVQADSENSVPTASGDPPMLTGSPRSDLSVILLDSQHQGIELGFNTNSIYSQSSDFTTSSEFVSSLLPSAMTSYSLTVLGTGYTLSSGGLTLLSGSIKQYAGVGFPASLVYNESNFLFVGDDTTANGGAFSFKAASVSVGSAAAAPEPAAVALLASAMLPIPIAIMRRRRLSR